MIDSKTPGNFTIIRQVHHQHIGLFTRFETSHGIARPKACAELIVAALIACSW